MTDHHLPESRIVVIAGHYGSGKTEIALNLALKMRRTTQPVTLVDLDIVNPFFRSAEQETLLREHDIELLKPLYANTGVDIPSLPPQIMGVFGRDEGRVIFDVGGDDTGAAALGSFAPQFAAADKQFCMVVNPYRPRSETVEQIIEMHDAIARRARMAPDALICNANLGDATQAEDVIAGSRIVKNAADILGLPVICLCAREEIAPFLPEGIAPVFTVRRYLKPEWMEE